MWSESLLAFAMWISRWNTANCYILNMYVIIGRWSTINMCPCLATLVCMRQAWNIGMKQIIYCPINIHITLHVVYATTDKLDIFYLHLWHLVVTKALEYTVSGNEPTSSMLQALVLHLRCFPRRRMHLQLDEDCRIMVMSGGNKSWITPNHKGFYAGIIYISELWAISTIGQLGVFTSNATGVLNK